MYRLFVKTFYSLSLNIFTYAKSLRNKLISKKLQSLNEEIF
jgi:hypothetical protein